VNIEYVKIEDLEEIAKESNGFVSCDEVTFNFIKAYEFSYKLLNGLGIRDCTEDAELWMLDEIPEGLHINHGSLVKGGMEHVVDELKRKPTSNRALLSFLSHNDVVGSNDDPIPSFMVFQVSVLDRVLYCTVYFRALEVSKFLRINIEEIRLRLKAIYSEQLDFERVRLVIHAYRAYNQPNASALRKSKLDCMMGAEIMMLLLEKPSDFSDLLIQKASDETVVSSDSIKELHKAVSLAESKVQGAPELLSLMDEVILLTERLNDIRTRQSHHPEVDQASLDLRNKVLSLAGVFEKCP